MRLLKRRQRPMPLALLEEPLQRADSQDARVAFAAEMIVQVKDKLENMQRSASPMSLTTLDYNEKIILTQAIKLYIVEVSTFPSNAQRALELQMCWQMMNSFKTD